MNRTTSKEKLQKEILSLAVKNYNEFIRKLNIFFNELRETGMQIDFNDLKGKKLNDMIDKIIVLGNRLKVANTRLSIIEEFYRKTLAKQKNPHEFSRDPCKSCSKNAPDLQSYRIHDT